MKIINFLQIILIVLLFQQTSFSQKKAELPQKITIAGKEDKTAASMGSPKKIAAGVLVYETELPTGRVWIYVPEKPAAEKLPCILIAPAGSRLIDGASLGEGSRPEHIPYATAGMIVVAYEIDGEPADDSDEATILASVAFKNSNAGLNNQRAALNYALDHFTRIDPNKIYAAGHSSAATHALLVAANEPRLKGVIAYAPAADIEKFLGAALTSLDQQIKGFRRFIAASSPANNIAKIRVPVFLFHSVADSTVPIKMTEDFAAKLKRSNGDVTLIKAASGDHYHSMINEGIPKAIAWIQERS